MMVRTHTHLEINWANMPDETLIDDPAVILLGGPRRESRRKMELQGKFPTRVKVGPRLNRWRLGEVKAWLRGEWDSEAA